MQTEIKENKKRFFSLLSVFFLDNFGLSVVYPIFTPLLLEPRYNFFASSVSYSTRASLLGLLIAAFPLALFFGSPILGIVADRLGRKKAFYFTLTGEMIGFILSGIAIRYHSYIFLICSRLLTGFFAGNLTLCLASISDVSKLEKTRSKNFGRLSAVAGGSFILSILIGGELSDRTLTPFFNASLPFYFTALISLLNLHIIIFFFFDSKEFLRHIKQRRAETRKKIFWILRTKVISILYLVFFLFMLGWVSSLQFLSAYLIENFHVNKAQIIGTFFSLGICWIIGNIFINKYLLKKFTPRRILLYSSLFLVIVYLLALSMRKYEWFALLISCSAIFSSLVWSNILSQITMKIPETRQGATLGLNQSIATIAMICSPLIGSVLGQVDTRMIYYFSTLSLLLSFLVICFHRLIYSTNRK